MALKKNCLFFEEWVLIDYLKINKKINLKSKSYELIVAILLKKLYEDRLKFGDCVIGFPLKDTNANDFPNHGLFNASELEKVISSRKVFDEDCDVDVVIAKRSENEINPLAVPYQLKRFGLGVEANGGTKEFIDFLKKYENYAKTQTKLMILIENGTREMDTKTILDWFNLKRYPFSEVDAVFMEKNIIKFIQFYPNPGVEEFNISDLELDIS